MIKYIISILPKKNTKVTHPLLINHNHYKPCPKRLTQQIVVKKTLSKSCYLAKTLVMQNTCKEDRNSILLSSPPSLALAYQQDLYRLKEH